VRRFLPEDHRERVDKMVDVVIRMEWRRSDAQPLSTARDGWIIDRLHIDAELIEKSIGDPLATNRITDHHWDNVTWIRQMWNTGRVEPQAHLRNPFLQTATFSAAALEMRDTRKSARGDCGRQCFFLYVYI
jgi:hypothetical protein